MTVSAWVVVLAALASLSVSVVGLRAPLRARSLALVIAVVGIAVMLGTRATWEVEVRRPLWVLDASRGRWLARGAAWTLSSLLCTGAASVRAFTPGGSRRAWSGAAILAAVALVAMAWASRQ